MNDNAFFWFLIGMNAGVGIGWYWCTKFKGDLKKLMKWLDGDSGASDDK